MYRSELNVNHIAVTTSGMEPVGKAADAAMQCEERRDGQLDLDL